MLVCPACGLQVPEGPACSVCGSSLAGAAPVVEPDESDWLPEPRPHEPEAREHGPQPLWVYLVFGVYVLLMATITFGPVLAAMAGGSLGALVVTLIFAFIVIVCGVSLVVIPIRAAQGLPNSQRSIWLPLIGSGALAMALFGGFALAAHEFNFGGTGRGNGDSTAYLMLAALPAVWLGWCVVFGMMASRIEPERFASRLYKSLLAGSLLELLIAIPMHMVVRQRGYCCAGFGTGMGIGIGLLVMLIALGPAVAFLFYRRYQQAYARHRRPE